MAGQIQNKDVAELVEKFKPGYELKMGGTGHWHVVGPDGEVRNEKNQPITIPGTPKAGGKHFLKSLASNLEKFGILQDGNGASPRERTPNEELREEAAQARMAVEEQLEEVKRFHQVSASWIKKLGGWDQRSLGTDLGMILMELDESTREQGLTAAHATVSHVKSGNAPGARGLAAMWKLHDLMMAQEDPREFYFDKVRELRGLNPVEISPGDEWPFTVELIKLDKLIVDERYQRPMHDIFVRELLLRFDERLVSTIDVSKRNGDEYAIMDGLQRTTVMREVGKTACYCSVYTGMTVAQEAEFFYHRNRDRKMIHPYYHFRARLVAGDEAVKAINKIVEKHGFRMASTSGPERAIAAIKAVEKVYEFSSPWRDDCLEPTLDMIKRLWFGRRAATDGELIRGLGRFHQAYSDEEIQHRHVEEVLAELGPQLVIGRAKDSLATLTGGRGGSSGGFGIGRTIAEIHNTGLPRVHRLDTRRLSSNAVVRRKAMAEATDE